jgi:hypothetical protein
MAVPIRRREKRTWILPKNSKRPIGLKYIESFVYAIIY